MAENFVQKTLDALLEVVEVEFKIPLGFAEIKFPVTAHAKKWWKNKKSRLEVEKAIQRAEESFIAAHSNQKVAQMLHELPLYSEEEFKQVIAGLLTHLSEEKITWLVEVNLKQTWGNVTNAAEIRKALELYIPYLRHELNGIKEFREVISALTLERIDKTTDKIDKTTERIEGKLDEAIKANQPKPSSSQTGWFFGHRYGDLESFTGRAEELKMLDAWLTNDSEALLMIRALGGFGKSALAWTWFNRVDREKWQTAVWWSFYEKESGFESFLAETLKHLGVEVKQSARQQVNDLLEALRGTNILIVLDGFERLLRQYGRMDAALQSDDEDAEIDPSQRDCSSPLTETFLRGLSGAGTKSKVLMTTRLCPRALESADGKLLKGCRDEPLSAFSPEDAVTYFHNEGIKATRAEIMAACSAYGYHPLSLSLLVGLINEDHAHRGDIEAVKKLEIFEDVRARRHHVLERAYESLAPERRDLLSKISCFRGSMEYAVLKKVFPSPDLDKALLDLRKRGLLQYAGESQRYDMHPIVRHYSYQRLVNKETVHENIAKYFQELFDYFQEQVIKNIPEPFPNTSSELNTLFRVNQRKKAKNLDELAPVIELYYHTVQAGDFDEAWDIFEVDLWEAIFYILCDYQTLIELLKFLFVDGFDNPPKLSDTMSQAIALRYLAHAYERAGQPQSAVGFYQKSIDLLGHTHQQVFRGKSYSRVTEQEYYTTLRSAAMCQIEIGALKDAESYLRPNLQQQPVSAIIELGGIKAYPLRISPNPRNVVEMYHLGRLLAYQGAWDEATEQLNRALKVFALDDLDADDEGIGLVEAFRAELVMLMNRASIQSHPENHIMVNYGQEKFGQDKFGQYEKHIYVQKEDINTILAIEFSRNSLYFAKIKHQFVRSYWLLGAAYRAHNKLTLAEENLSKALNLCRQINNFEREANILLDLARLRYAQGDFKDALEKASEALMITERSGYVLQGADVNLFLAQYALEQEKDKAKAKQYAETALKLAHCDDGPPYYYKVAYEEAERMLEKLK